MFLLQSSSATFFDWNQIFFGEHDWKFLIETAFRTLMMFAIILLGLSILGKRGVRQLSVFELVVIIGLGSAAGDPMFYKEVGILPALVVFTMVIGLYIMVTYFVGKSKRFEQLVEGKPVCLIRDGRFCIQDFEKESLAQDEFFAELRMQGVSQLGQIEQAIAETSGSISIFFFPDEEVKHGLPILPDSLEDSSEEIKQKDFYACTFCGNTEEFEKASLQICKGCKKTKWVKASNKKRVS